MSNEQATFHVRSMNFSNLIPYSDCQCAILMVKALASHIGNCKRLNSNGISVGIIGIPFGIHLFP